MLDSSYWNYVPECEYAIKRVLESGLQLIVSKSWILKMSLHNRTHCEYHEMSHTYSTSSRSSHLLILENI